MSGSERWPDGPRARGLCAPPPLAPTAAWMLAPVALVAPIAPIAPVALGCAGEQSALAPRGPQAGRLFELTQVMTVGGAVVLLVVLVLVALAVALPKRERDGDDAEVSRRARVPIGAGAGVTVAILVALAVYSMTVSRAISAEPENPIRIEVTAKQWWWDVTYPGSPPSETIRTANELHVPVGRPVEITLESADVIHSFWVPNLHGKMDAIPGRTNKLWLQADAPGVYRGQCAEFCGLQHAKMAFFVVAEPPEDFERWLDAQRLPAPEPASEMAKRGRAEFLRGSCALCHAVRGTEAYAQAGPDLTHLASRRSLAAGTLPNQRGALGGWILDPQHVKPGTFMPPSEIDAEGVHALLHYLESLR